MRLRNLAADVRASRGAPPYVMTMQGSEERYVRAMRMEERKGRAWNFSWKNRLWHRVYHQTMYDYSIKTADYGAVANREGWICAELKYKASSGPLLVCAERGGGAVFCLARISGENLRSICSL